MIAEILATEDRVDRAARKKIRTQKREIPEGTEEWDVLHRPLLLRGVEETGYRHRIPMTASIVVVGSLNMDFVVSTERLPIPGETRARQQLPDDSRRQGR